jgi:LCP family protein required for cell wall assembly
MWCTCGRPNDKYRWCVQSDAPLNRITSAPRWVLVLGTALVIALAGAVGLVRAANAGMDGVARVSSVAAVLSPATPGVENYLLVGSDSREGADPSDPDFANVGSADKNPGRRSDTLMILRYDTASGTVSLMSVPRDLYVRIGNGERFDRINSAYRTGPDVVVTTVQRALNIPIHHYLEVDFQGFKRIVDAVGGVEVCVDRASRDKATGFYIGRRACKVVGGAQALAYARSRHFEQKYKDEGWKMDPTADLGRTARQRKFVTALLKAAARYVAANPLRAASVMRQSASAVSVDPGLDLVDLARKLKPVADGGTVSYPLPVALDMVGDMSVVRLTNESSALLAYFAGTGPAPAPPAS